MFFISKIIWLFIFLSDINCDCGNRATGRGVVYNGNRIDASQWPWLSRLFYTKLNKYFCGGSLISEKHILTAAHCLQVTSKTIQPNALFAMLGGINISNLNETRWIRREIKSIKIHPDYRKNTNGLAQYDADIAVLGLKIKVIFNSFIRKICLPSEDEDIKHKTGFVVGHGVDESQKVQEIAREIEVSTIEAADCVWLDQSYITTISRDRMFCAGGAGKIACEGDSGGGFYALSNNRWNLYGIISATILDNNEECDRNLPTAFTQVSKYSDWIIETMKQNIDLVVTMRKTFNVGNIIEINLSVDPKTPFYLDEFEIEHNLNFKNLTGEKITIKIGTPQRIYVKGIQSGQMNVLFILKMAKMAVDNIEIEINILSSEDNMTTTENNVENIVKIIDIDEEINVYYEEYEEAMKGNPSSELLLKEQEKTIKKFESNAQGIDFNTYQRLMQELEAKTSIFSFIRKKEAVNSEAERLVELGKRKWDDALDLEAEGKNSEATIKFKEAVKYFKQAYKVLLSIINDNIENVEFFFLVSSAK